MFPRAQDLLGTEGLERMGDRMTREKEKLFESRQGAVTRPLRRVKSLADKVTPLSVKRKTVERRAKRDPDHRS